MALTLETIEATAALIGDAVLRTPTIRSEPLSALTGTGLALKLESLQHTGSFKVRGAFVKMSGLDDAARKAGVVAASAGNHAQGVAFWARRLCVPATIVMPEGTPFTKISRTEGLGSRVVIAGSDLSESREHALGLVESEGLEFIHPYDDPDIIAGQGTVALEMLADAPDLDCLVVPIGGGGLMAGVAIVAKALKPGIEVIGVEAGLYPSMRRSIDGSTSLDCGGQTVAEGIAVKQPGGLTLPIIDSLVDDIVLVEESALEGAVHTFIEHQRLVVEGAGAAPLAAVLNDPDRFAGKSVGLVVSGGNIDSRLLSSILMRGLVRQGRLVRLRVEITDSPGVLAKVSGIIGAAGGNIVEVYHQRLFFDVPVKLAEVDVVIETRDSGHVAEVIERLTSADYPVRLLGATSSTDGG